MCNTFQIETYFDLPLSKNISNSGLINATVLTL